MFVHFLKGGAKKTRSPGMFPRGVSGVRLGHTEDSTPEILAQGKQVRLLYMLLLLASTLVSPVFFFLYSLSLVSLLALTFASLFRAICSLRSKVF